MPKLLERLGDTLLDRLAPATAPAAPTAGCGQSPWDERCYCAGGLLLVRHCYLADDCATVICGDCTFVGHC